MAHEEICRHRRKERYERNTACRYKQAVYKRRKIMHCLKRFDKVFKRWICTYRKGIAHDLHVAFERIDDNNQKWKNKNQKKKPQEY
jgi:hypothetical protein